MDEKSNDFKYIVDNELKDIVVSEKLKKKTLERCKATRFQSKKVIASPIIAIATAAMIGIFIAIPSFMKPKNVENAKFQEKTNNYAMDNIESAKTKDNSENTEIKSINKTNNSKGKEKEVKPNTGVTKNAIIKENNSKVKNSDNLAMNVPSSDKIKTSVAGEKTLTSIDTNKNREVKQKSLDAKPKSKASITPIESNNYANEDKKSNDVTVALKSNYNFINVSEDTAKSILKDEFKLPDYIPQGFKIDEILIPKFSGESNTLFEIRYFSEYERFSIVKVINEDAKLNNSEIIKIKDKDVNCISVNENSSNKYVILTWNENNYMQKVSGNVTKQELIKVVESLIN